MKKAILVAAIEALTLQVTALKQDCQKSFDDAIHLGAELAEAAAHVRQLREISSACSRANDELREKLETLRCQSLKDDERISKLRQRLKIAGLDDSLPNVGDDVDNVILIEVEDEIADDDERSYGKRDKLKR